MPPSHTCTLNMCKYINAFILYIPRSSYSTHHFPFHDYISLQSVFIDRHWYHFNCVVQKLSAFLCVFDCICSNFRQLVADIGHVMVPHCPLFRVIVSTFGWQFSRFTLFSLLNICSCVCMYICSADCGSHKCSGINQ